MKRIVRLTESDLNRIVRRVIEETTSNDDCSKIDPRFVGCGSLGVKSPGCCETSTKRMVILCKEKFPDSKLFGYCYNDTKEVKPVPPTTNGNQGIDY